MAETLCSPKPLTNPRPPIMIGGSGEKKTLRLVAKYADACNLFTPSVDEVRRKLEVLRRHCDDEGRESPIRLKDILVVAPYNLQVAALQEALPDGARVGTVDKFQGQEAPVVIYSMTSSSVEDAPRGMGFLYSPNRLNVATSRARCLAIVVGNPALFTPDCRTPDQMRLANAFCRFLELSEAGDA